MKRLVLLSSMPFESDLILSRMKNVREIEISGKTIYKGRYSHHAIVLADTGIGKVNAAVCLTGIKERSPLEAVINVGVGGAYPGAGLSIGDIAIASKEIYGDEGVIDSGGWHSLKKIGIPLAEINGEKYFNEYSLENQMFKNVVKIAGSGTNINVKIKTGKFVTVSTTTGMLKKARQFRKRFGAICENMEGAAIAHVCVMSRTPVLEIRGISNMVGVRDKRRWNLNLAAENCQKFVLEVLDRFA